MSDPVQVRNAADRGQVERAGDRDQVQQEERLDAIRQVLSTVGGRRAVYEWCVKLGLFRSVYANSAQIYHAAGMQDAAREIWQSCEDAHLEAVEQMHIEALARQRDALLEVKRARKAERAR